MNIAQQFTHEFLKNRVWSKHVYWNGIQILKNPCDLWMYQQIIYEVRPVLIIEFGTFQGGTALYLSDIGFLSQCGCYVITVDVEDQVDSKIKDHARIKFIQGNSLDQQVIDRIHDGAKHYSKHGPVLIIEDSDHHYSTVQQELQHYAHLVTPGSYFIVEDTRKENGAYESSPQRAIDEWITNNPDWIQDSSREVFGLTFNRGGYLKRING
jgi:cephalosporin hydroxylase